MSFSITSLPEIRAGAAAPFLAVMLEAHRSVCCSLRHAGDLSSLEICPMLSMGTFVPLLSENGTNLYHLAHSHLARCLVQYPCMALKKPHLKKAPRNV